MLKYILTFLLCAIPKFALADASEAYLMQKRVVEQMKAEYPGVEVKMVWEPCEQVNAFYYWAEKKIVMCTETESAPGVGVVFAAHEMGHAIAHQLLNVEDEGMADEIAADFLVRNGYSMELLQTSLYFKERPNQGRSSRAGHPAPAYRAWFFACMAASVDGHKGCQEVARITRVKLALRLHYFRS